MDNLIVRRVAIELQGLLYDLVYIIIITIIIIITNNFVPHISFSFLKLFSKIKRVGLNGSYIVL